MGNHGTAAAPGRASRASKHAREATSLSLPGPRTRALRDRPVAWRLLAVTALAIAMGLVFGGLRVASAASSAASFGRVSQLASLGQHVTVLVQALENERDHTTGAAPINTADQRALLQPAYNATNSAAASVQALASGIGGSFPANIQAKVGTVLSVAGNLAQLRATAQDGQSALAVIAAYAPAIDDMISLNGQIAQGTSDAALANEVQTLDSLSLAKDEASQQRALLYNALLSNNFADGELQALTTAQSVQATDQTAFGTTATPAESSAFVNSVRGQQRVNEAESIETYILDNGDVAKGSLGQHGFSPRGLPGTWFADMSATINSMQGVEQRVAANIVARAKALQQGAVSAALLTSILTVVILLIVAVATLLVTRSLVLPLRRLRAEALEIASVQLPERVRQLGESADAASSLDVVPIDVTSRDEIGQVARAFDQVHAEALRLAGNEALQRTRYNAMFVNLSRRSQSLIERLVRTIDSLEQNEDDPGRLSSLFAMDHLVTRMRRNSENLLLLAGHETARKWSEPVPLTDVARAAISEIEQYSRVTLSIQQGVSIAGSAASDVVHLLAEVVENATTFSPRDTQVQLTAEDVASGGLLIEVVDSGVGIPDETLAEINERLDKPPVMDVSASRHMGLFAVARLAERHRIRVRLRGRPPQGIIAMVWLPDDIVQHGDRAFGKAHQALRQGGVSGRRTASTTTRSSLPSPPDLPPRPPAAAPDLPSRTPAAPVSPVAASSGDMARPASGPSSKWFSEPGAQRGGGAGTSDGQSWAGGDLRLPGAARIVADPVRGDQTRSGLPMRVPQANILPGSIDGAFRTDGGPPSRQADRPDMQSSMQGWPPRSADVARGRLSGFQRGVRRGKSQIPRGGERSDR